MTEPNKNLRILEAVADEAARTEIEDGAPTKESRAAVGRYQTFIADQLASMRRSEIEHVPANAERRPIHRSLLAMARDALIARLDELQRATPMLGFAHQDLTHVTDDDLRTMIEDAELAAERHGDPA